MMTSRSRKIVELALNITKRGDESANTVGDCENTHIGLKKTTYNQLQVSKQGKEILKRVAENEEQEDRPFKKARISSESADEISDMPTAVIGKRKSKIGKRKSSVLQENGTESSEETVPTKIKSKTPSDLISAKSNEGNGGKLNGIVENSEVHSPVSSKMNGQIDVDDDKEKKEKPSVKSTNMKDRKIMNLFLNGKDEITVNKSMLEDLVMMKIAEYLADKGPTGELRALCKKSEEEIERLRRQVTNFKKQYEDARRVIKKLIDEKMSGKPWTNAVIPPKVTRSVGLQVTICGSMNVKPVPQPKSSLAPAPRPMPPLQERIPVKPSEKPTPPPPVRAVRSTQPPPPQVTMHAARPVPTNNANTPNKTQPQPTPAAFRPSPLRQNNAKKSKTPAVRIVNNRPLRPVPKPIAQPPLPINNSVQVTPVRSNPATPAKISVNEVIDLTDTPVRSNPAPPAKISVNEVIDLTDKDDVQETTVAPTVVPTAVTKKPADLPQNSIQLKITSSRSDRDSTLPDSAATNQDSPGVTLKASKLVKKLTTPQLSNPVPPPPPTPSLTNIPLEMEVTTSPAPYPPLPKAPAYSPKISRPPTPILRICKSQQPGPCGIRLSWNFSNDEKPNIWKYQVFAYQEGSEESTAQWKKVGDVDALPLPMACRLTQLKDGFKYHFAIRAIDNNMRVGEFSTPGVYFS